MMHVLVTGAAGFIGSHTCEQLIARGNRVTGFDAFDGFLYPADIKRARAADLASLPADRFRLVEGNICDRDAVASVLTEDVDVVCHLAALAGVRPSLADPLRYVQANVVGTTTILERMRELGRRRLVFASSSSVYGAKPATDTPAFREDDPCLTPASPYAATKRMNELELSTYRDLFGIGTFALRYFTVYGPRQRPDMAIHKFTRAIARGEPITMFGDGSSRRDYTYVDDIIAGTVAAIERVRPGQLDIVNLGGTATISLRDLIELIERSVGKRAVVEQLPEQPGDVPITYANIDRARAMLDYQPTTPIADGIPRFWEWFSRR